jgi:iron complex transport system ATP-binding protein
MTSLVASRIALPGRIGPTDLNVTDGELVALAGPNGGGKTSLLRSLARVEEAGGKITIDGHDVDQMSEAQRRRLLAFVPASRDVGWPISARDVIALGLGTRDDGRIDELVALFELRSFIDRPVNSLSTGERARVLIARALAARPRLLLLDEPLANLEPYWVLRLLEILRAVAEEGAMVLVALHDLIQLPAFDRALLIDGGKVQLDKTPASLMASERFEIIFRIRPSSGGWSIRR